MIPFDADNAVTAKIMRQLKQQPRERKLAWLEALADVAGDTA